MNRNESGKQMTVEQIIDDMDQGYFGGQDVGTGKRRRKLWEINSTY